MTQYDRAANLIRLKDRLLYDCGIQGLLSFTEVFLKHGSIDAPFSRSNEPVILALYL